MSLSLIYERFNNDSPNIRLGGIAANLARIYSFTTKLNHKDGVEGLLNESKYFIEWTAKETDLETQIYLLELQRQLIAWQFHFSEIWNDESKKQKMANKAKEYSDRILTMSGLLNK